MLGRERGVACPNMETLRSSVKNFIRRLKTREAALPISVVQGKGVKCAESVIAGR